MWFLGLWKIEFLWPKKVSFLSRTLFLVLFWPKTTQERKYIFWPKARVNPFGKIRFLGLWKITFLGAKHFCFLIRTLFNIISGLILTENNSRKKNTFFDQKHRLTPLEKCDFWDFERLLFYGQKGFLFYLAHYLTLFLVLFWPKTSKKNYIFWPKAWVNPFGKMRFLGLWKITFFRAKKGFFSI